AGWMAFNRDLFERATIQRMLKHFEKMLEEVATDPGVRISEIEFLSATERDQLLIEWNNTTSDSPSDKCIHQLFEEQAAKRPEAVAIADGDREITYQELNATANKLAHYLRQYGLSSDLRAGICIERSLDTIVGLLAILKAGGVYVPLDPDYPLERIAFMLED